MKRIYAQIEETADLYAPSVYALLPIFRDFQKEFDPTSGEFKPLTQIAATDIKNSKIFAIGILPPSVKVTGRLLDRSAQLGGDAGDAAAIAAALQANPSSVPSSAISPAGSDCTASVLEAQMAGTQTDESHLAFMAGPDDYIDGKLNPFTEAYYLQKGDTTSVGALVGTGGHGRTHCCQTALAAMRKCGVQDPAFMRSQTSYKILKDGRMITDVDNRYGACTWVTTAQKNGAFVSGADESKFPVRGSAVIARRVTKTVLGEVETGQHAFTIIQSDGARVTTSADGGGFKAHVYKVGQTWNFRDGNWYVTDQWGTVRRVFGWTDPAKMPMGDTGEVPPDTAPSTDYQDTGSDAAKDAAKQAEQTDGKDPKKGPTAEDFLKAQQRMINATREALDRINATPPLKMLVNPISFKPSNEKIVSDGNRSRSHHIIEHWGEQQEKIEGSGKLLGFYSADTVGPGPGITRTARHYSVSYQNFMSLFLLYKSNGGVWLEDFFDVRVDKGAMNLSALGSIYIYYDNILYIGSFDSLSTSETDTAPYTMEYNFSFTVRASFLLDRELENTSQSYGAPGLFAGALQGTSDAPIGSPVQKQYTEEELFTQHDEVVAEWESEDRAEANKKAADDLFASPPPDLGGGNNAITPGKGSKTKSTGR